MAVTFAERADSRQIVQDVNTSTVRLHWFGQGSTDESIVSDALLAFAPVEWDGLALVGQRCDPLGVSGNWDCFSDYAFSAETIGELEPNDPPGLDDPLGPNQSFDLTAQTTHITQSLATVRAVFGGSVNNKNTTWLPNTAYAANDQVIANGNIYICATPGTSSSTGTGPSGTGGGIDDGSVVWGEVGPDVPIDPAAPNFHGAIAVAADRVGGTDVYSGHLEFGIIAQVYPVTINLILDLLFAIGTINETEWYGFAPKTVLYLGCTGTCKPGQVWTLAHKFAISPNLENIPIGPNIIVAMKAGWDFLWATYAPQLVGSYLLQVPTAAYVEQVYRLSDFSDIPV